MSLTQSGILRGIPIGVSMEEINRVEEFHILYYLKIYMYLSELFLLIIMKIT